MRATLTLYDTHTLEPIDYKKPAKCVHTRNAHLARSGFTDS